MDDLWVIIIMAVLGIAGASSRKRKRPELVGRAPGTSQKNDFLDFFSEESIFQKPEPEERSYEVLEPEPGPATNEQNYAFDARNEGGSIINHEIPKTESIKTNLKNKVDFSLRKAVIYSEILNRKYV